MARILILGGGRRGRRLARGMVAEGHAVRVSTRTEDGRQAIELTGAECWIGTPDRLATMRGVLDSVTVACWMFGTACGSEHELRELHRERLEFFLMGLIDTTVRGLVYEGRGTGTHADILDGGRAITERITARNAIPATFLEADPQDEDGWITAARAAISETLAPSR